MGRTSTYDDLFMINTERTLYPSLGATSSVNRSTKTNTSKNSNYGTMSSYEVMRATDDCLRFTGKWEKFLGNPERNFYMILSAQPGFGKSTFALDFANYLATDHGRTIYFTNEENASRIRRKLEFIGAKLAKFDINFTANDPATITRIVDSGRYDHVFIDSAQNAGFGYKDLWRFHETHPKTSLVAICRQTKDGKTRGSQNQEYDGDITIIFKKQGVAQTIKNRFNDLKTFVVFNANTSDDEEEFGF